MKPWCRQGLRRSLLGLLLVPGVAVHTGCVDWTSQAEANQADEPRSAASQYQEKPPPGDRVAPVSPAASRSDTTPASNGATPAQSRDVLMPPAGKVWFGAFTTMDEAATTRDFERLGKRVDKPPAIHMIFRPWPANGEVNFPGRFARLSHRMGAIPMVTWEPWWDYSEEHYPLLRDIAAGKHDEYIESFLAEAAAFDRPWFLRFGHEMEMDYYPWSEAFDRRQTRRDYIDAFVHIRQLALTLAPKTQMMWSPNSGSAKAFGFYPGDRHVDWIGASLYNFPDTPQDPAHGDKLGGFSRMVRQIGKPAMIAEMGCAQNYTPTRNWDANGDGDFADRQRWIDPQMADKVRCIDRVFDVVESEFPEIRGLIWFDIDKDADWRLASSKSALAAFRQRIAASRYVAAQHRNKN